MCTGVVQWSDCSRIFFYYKSFQAHIKVLDVFPKMRLAQNTQLTTVDLVEMENVLPILMAVSVEDRVFSLKIPYIKVESLNPARW